MTHRDFLLRISGAAILALLFAVILRLGLGPRWFGFYGWATVALAAAPFVTWLLWKRLPSAGYSRWWSLLVGVPISLAALIQIVFWSVFFSKGATNPMFGVLREMVRPWIDTGEPFAIAIFVTICLWLLVAAARPVERA